MKTVRILMLCALMASFTVSMCHEEDALTRLEQIEEHSIFASVKQFAQEHTWCLIAITACLGYIYLQKARPIKRYNGPLAEAHEKIQELEAALKGYEAIALAVNGEISWAEAYIRLGASRG